MSVEVRVQGRVVKVRPLTAADAPAFREAWTHLSPASRRSRFFGTAPNLTDEMVRYLTEVDGTDHIALAAVVDTPDLKSETGIGVARCIRSKEEPDVAEAAVTVIDDMQGYGVGRLLVEALAREARAHGIRRFRGIVLADNAKMRRLLSDLGIVPTLDDDGSMTFDVDITSAPASDEKASAPSVRRWMRRGRPT